MLQDESKEGLTAPKIAEMNLNEEVNNYFQGSDYTSKVEVSTRRNHCKSNGIETSLYSYEVNSVRK